MPHDDDEKTTDETSEPFDELLDTERWAAWRGLAALHRATFTRTEQLNALDAMAYELVSVRARQQDLLRQLESFGATLGKRCDVTTSVAYQMRGAIAQLDATLAWLTPLIEFSHGIANVSAHDAQDVRERSE